MSIEVDALSELSSSDVQNNMLVLSRMMQEQFPELDFSGGALHDIVLYLQSVLFTKTSTEIDRYKAAQSLLAIEKDSSLADDGVVDNVMSNYNVTRKSATFATGTLTVETDVDSSIIIPLNTKFTHEGVTFINNDSVLICDSESERTPRLTRFANGAYGYTFDVTAEEAGVIDPIEKDATFEADLYGVTSIYAASDFTTGSSEETNSSMLKRLSEGMATPCWGNRYNIASIARSKFSYLTAISIVGFGDSEMIRDKTTIFPVAVGGCTDIYVKTYSETKQYSTTATWLGRSGINDLWQCTIPANAYPGCWRATHACLDDGRSYTVTNQIVIGGIEGTDTQMLSVRFETDDLFITARGGATSKDFSITLVGQHGVGAITDTFSERDLMPVSADARVLTARPAWISVSLKLSGYASNTSEIKSAVSDYIASTDFCGRIPASEILKVVLPLLDTGIQIIETHLSMEVWGPDNLVYRATSSQSVSIPDDPLNGVSAKTTAFYCDSVDIGYEV